MMKTMVQETMRIDDAKIYYETAGQGEDIVLVHAGFVDSRMWDDVFARLSQAFRVTRYDMRGFGQSSTLQGPVVRRQELLQVMQRLGIEKAVLIGCSLGGEIILDLALEHPEVVRALVLVSSVPGGFELQGEPPPGMMEMFSAIEQNDIQRAVALQVRVLVDGINRTPDQMDAQVRQRAAEMSRTALTNGAYVASLQPHQPLDPPAVQRLGEIQAPALVIAGALDHPELLRAAEFIGQGIPNAKKVILPDSGHMASMEQPAAFNAAVLDFLNAAGIKQQK